MSDEAEKKLRSFFRQDNLTLHSSREEFVSSLGITGTNDGEEKIVYYLYDKHKQVVEKSNQELPCPTTPNTTSDEIQRTYYSTNDHSQSSHNVKLGYFIKPLFALETIDVELSVEERLDLLDDDYEECFAREDHYGGAF